MTGRIGVAELRLRLASVLDAAGSGSVYIVTRTGRDVAVIGPSSGAVSALSRAADDCANALREAQSAKASAMAEAARLRARVDDLEEQLSNARELNPGRKRWGK